MSGKNRLALAGALLVIVGFMAGTACAEFDQTGKYGSWSGTSTFGNVDEPGVGLSGYVNWIVYGPDGFPYEGYSDTPGKLTYVYQLFNTGGVAISEFIIPTSNPAVNIGSFSDAGITGYAPVSVGLPPDWYFSEYEGSAIPGGGNSNGLAYSSTNTPELYYGVTIDGGEVEFVPALPAPSATPIPEPATWCSLMLAFGLMGLWRLVRK